MARYTLLIAALAVFLATTPSITYSLPAVENSASQASDKHAEWRRALAVEVEELARQIEADEKVHPDDRVRLVRELKDGWQSDKVPDPVDPAVFADRSRDVAMFAVINDIHHAPISSKGLGQEEYRLSRSKVADMVKRFNHERPDFLLLNGDTKDMRKSTKCMECDALTYLREIEETIQQFRGRIYHTIGNHDDDVIPKRLYLKYAPSYGRPRTIEGATHYSFDDHHLHYIVLDANHFEDGDDHDANHFHKRMRDNDHFYMPQWQLDWLEQDLLANKQRNVVVMIHQRLNSGYYLYGVTNSEPVRALFEAHGGVLLVMQGHQHFPGHEFADLRNGIYYYTARAVVNTGERDSLLVHIRDDCSVFVEGMDTMRMYSMDFAYDDRDERRFCALGGVPLREGPSEYDEDWLEADLSEDDSFLGENHHSFEDSPDNEGDYEWLPQAQMAVSMASSGEESLGHLLDSNPATAWTAAGAVDEWVVLDLERVKHIEGLRITPVAGHVHMAKLQVGPTPVGPWRGMGLTFHVPERDSSFIVAFDPAHGQYFRLFVKNTQGGGPVSIAEVELFGRISQPPADDTGSEASGGGGARGDSAHRHHGSSGSSSSSSRHHKSQRNEQAQPLPASATWLRKRQ